VGWERPLNYTGSMCQFRDLAGDRQVLPADRGKALAGWRAELIDERIR